MCVCVRACMYVCMCLGILVIMRNKTHSGGAIFKK